MGKIQAEEQSRNHWNALRLERDCAPTFGVRRVVLRQVARVGGVHPLTRTIGPQLPADCLPLYLDCTVLPTPLVAETKTDEDIRTQVDSRLQSSEHKGYARDKTGRWANTIMSDAGRRGGLACVTGRGAGGVTATIVYCGQSEGHSLLLPNLTRYDVQCVIYYMCFIRSSTKVRLSGLNETAERRRAPADRLADERNAGTGYNYGMMGTKLFTQVAYHIFRNRLRGIIEERHFQSLQASGREHVPAY
ncbi:hypothetical protein J6590_039512 [Homalodisca vitripennis]|nr:hypothetical protein J6590_039512 [Homalodisca vitripennis]